MESLSPASEKKLSSLRRLSYPLVFLMATVGGHVRNVMHEPTPATDISCNERVSGPCIDELSEGDSLFDRDLFIEIQDEKLHTRRIAFRIGKDANGAHLKVGNKRFRSKFSVINRAIDAVTVEQKEPAVFSLSSRMIGKAQIPQWELERIICILSKGHNVNEIVVDAQFEAGMLANMIVSMLSEDTDEDPNTDHITSQSGYPIIFKSDDVDAEQIAQLKF